MKKRTIFAAMALTAALLPSCSGGGNTGNGATQEQTKGEEATPASCVGTYEGTIPAADGPGLVTTLTLNADKTYGLTQKSAEDSTTVDEASGVFEQGADGVIALVRPSGGERTFFKVRDAQSVVMTDSVGNEAQGETADFYVLTKKQQ